MIRASRFQRTVQQQSQSRFFGKIHPSLNLISPGTTQIIPRLQNEPNADLTVIPIDKSEFDNLSCDKCPICIDHHTNGETVITDCNHRFGFVCWNTWMGNPNSNRCCPTCRKFMPGTATFIIR